MSDLIPLYLLPLLVSLGVYAFVRWQKNDIFFGKSFVASLINNVKAPLDFLLLWLIFQVLTYVVFK